MEGTDFSLKYFSYTGVARRRRRDDRPSLSDKKNVKGLSGKCEETRNSCLLSVKYGLRVAT
jgi:hypothetical protein